MPPETTLWQSLAAVGPLAGRTLWAAGDYVALGELERGSSLGGRLAELRDRSVMIATTEQLTAALALIELDGVARRVVLCPPDLPAEHVPAVIATAEVDAVVTDAGAPARRDVATTVPCTARIAPARPDRQAGGVTEWILLTSGTTGVPKLVVHTLATLTGAIKSDAGGPAATWSTFYDIRRYGGLQILLRALLSRASLVLSSAGEPTGAFLGRAGAAGITHISGTPSHWRRALMSPMAKTIDPAYVRLSGEISDQAVLDQLRGMYPGAAIGHAFASTEAGVAFAVNDGRAGFPASYLDQPGAEVEMTVRDGSLRIRSARTALGYLGGEPLRGADGFVDTNDMVERRGDRCYFAGRRGGVINVGGLKVHPEEVEAVINGHPSVRMSLVRTRKNPITGALVVAEVVPAIARDPGDAMLAALEQEILQRCRSELPRHKVPATIRFVPSLAVAATGKIARRHA